MREYRLPENAEGAIVGCVLLCPEVRPEVARLISESDFASPAFGAMFAAAMELEEPDSVAFQEKVKARGYALPDGFFSALSEVAVNRYNVELYAQLLREDAQRRQLRELAQQLGDSAAAEDDPAEMITAAVSRLAEIEQGSCVAEVAAPDDSFRAF